MFKVGDKVTVKSIDQTRNFCGLQPPYYEQQLVGREHTVERVDDDHAWISGWWVTFDNLIPVAQEVQTKQDGARKDDKGKADFKYLQYVGRALAACCKVWEGGYIKYGEVGGWLRVPDGINRYKSALLRHELYYPSLGEIHDKELTELVGESVLHETCVAVNSLMRLELILREQEKSQNDS